jgi:hypothetical protein
VKREKVDSKLLEGFDPTVWHTYQVRLEGEDVTVHLDGKKIMQMTDDSSSRRGFISLQHNQGIVEFRNVLLRPIGSQKIKLDSSWQEDWTTGEKEPGTLKVSSSETGLRVQGGLGKVQSRKSFGDFWLQTKYTLASPEVNTGIFFRCLEEGMLDGYECQVNHAVSNNDPLSPVDSGAGAIFRRKPARIVIGDGTKPTYLSLVACENQLVTWINGVLVTEFMDDRKPDDNPRRGKRLASGPVALQGHDPATDATYHEMAIAELR